MPKIVILRGRPTSGKSTAWQNLKKRKELKKWKFVDNAGMKHKLGKERGKIALMEALKEEMRNQENLIIEEMSEKSLKRYIRYYIKKYEYKIITFQFTVSTKTAYKRDVQRAKDKLHPKMGKKWIKEMHEWHDKRVDPKGIMVDADKLNRKQAVDFIIKKIK